MAGATDTTIASAINKYVDGVWDTLDSRATPLIDFAGSDTNVVGDSVDWVVQSAGNTSTTTFVEGDDGAAAGYNTFYSLTLAKSAFQYRTVYQVSGTAIDSARGGYFDVIQRESMGAMLDHQAYLEEALVTNFEASVDSGDSYGGATRANANTASYENAVGPSVADMHTAQVSMMADPRSANWAELQMLAPIEFQNSYATVAAGVSGTYPMQAMQGGIVDAGKLSNISFGGKPFTTIGTMTDTTCLLLGPNNCARKVWRGLDPQIKASNRDSIVVHLVSVIVPVIWNPRIAGKLT